MVCFGLARDYFDLQKMPVDTSVSFMYRLNSNGMNGFCAWYKLMIFQPHFSNSTHLMSSQLNLERLKVTTKFIRRIGMC